jgi:hypothetical protein
MTEKDLVIGKKYLLKRNTSKRTWKWVDKAELVEMEDDILTFINRETDIPWVYRVDKEEFLSGGRVKLKNCWWVDKWKNYGIEKYG